MVFYIIIAVGILGALTFISMWMAPRDGYARSNKFYEEQEAIDGLHEGESHESK